MDSGIKFRNDRRGGFPPENCGNDDVEVDSVVPENIVGIFNKPRNDSGCWNSAIRSSPTTAAKASAVA